MLKFTIWKPVAEIGSLPVSIRNNYLGASPVLVNGIYKQHRSELKTKANDNNPKEWVWRLFFDATSQPHEWNWVNGIGWYGHVVPPQVIPLPSLKTSLRVPTPAEIAMWLFYRRIENVESSIEGENPTGIDFVNEWNQLQKEFNYDSTSPIIKYEELWNNDEEFRNIFAPPRSNTVQAVTPLTEGPLPSHMMTPIIKEAKQQNNQQDMDEEYQPTVFPQVDL